MWCLGMRSSQKKLFNKGLDRIERELDLVKYIKKQMMIDTVFELLFTKVDRILLKNQAKFVLNKSSSDDEWNEYGDELQFETIQQAG